MLSSCDGQENEVFFDSLDRLCTEEVEEGEFGCEFGFKIWADEPRSVEERRKSFFQQMGFLEERIMDCDESVSQHCPEDGLEEQEEANSMAFVEQSSGFFSPNESPVKEEIEECQLEECRKNLGDGAKRSRRKAMRDWWKRFVKSRKEKKRVDQIETPKEASKVVKMCRNNKRFLELTAPFFGQEIRAHKGFVWTMKFSPDGQYLATAGEDGAVRIWRVMTVETSSDHLREGNLCSKLTDKKFGFTRKHPIHASVVFPERIFRIDESPIQEFYGHSSDVLDLAWSSSNRILSSSMDKTVRLWELGRDECVNVFRHNDYVTCIEFNPVDDKYFISGSIDGKVRIWGLSEERVVDWTDVRDLITAISYQPDGKGFMVGTITGTCRSYKTSGECMQLEAKINISGRKKIAGHKITGIKFSHDKPQRVMISSEDSKVRIFDGVDLIHKYKGLAKSGSHTSASFTSSERHIVSVGDDSRVYIWNYEPSLLSKHTKSVRSCEHFVHEGVSVAVPWPGMTIGRGDSSYGRGIVSQPQLHERVESISWSKDSDRFSLGSWFSVDGPCTKGSATWPEEKLPLWESSTAEEDQICLEQNKTRQVSEAWGLVIVAAGLDGTIRTVHNYGLPIRL